MASFVRMAAFAAFALFASPPAPAAGATAGGLVDELARAAPNADRKVLQLAANAVTCVRARDPANTPRTLSVIDYSKPSTQRRLWVFDLSAATLLFEEWVAHGRNSGGNLAERFSNDAGSLMSSVGVFVTEGTYTGHNGYSLRLRGLDAGFNDHAFERAIVMHGADYVSEGVIKGQGRLGRSLGCPAVRREVAMPLIDTIRDGSLVFAYFPLAEWLRSSSYVGGCTTGGAATGAAAAP
ncbi:murein L,D-transpeptidase catalytic domain family protein [Tahibacter caeni]|uniref:murein L,D-transpeptidase catalytic domain family protein n=1 Tax=Tahibacter caeni TaxID=1453545 RepID=UPI00214849B3|nr:murein L,D-transpeptidase catalytic domain family protein [Tahibacter caeni]